MCNTFRNRAEGLSREMCKQASMCNDFTLPYDFMEMWWNKDRYNS